jgi:hypothetical protein
MPRYNAAVSRRLLNFLTGLSLLLCVVVAGLWVRSYYVTDIACGEFGNISLAASTAVDGVPSPGRALLEVSTGDGEEAFRFRHSASDVHDAPTVCLARGVGTMHVAKGFGYGSGSQPATLFQPAVEWRAAVVPLWAVVLTLAVPPSLRLAAWGRSRRRLKDGRCRACGYDLRATPGRCPECGADPAPVPARWRPWRPSASHPLSGGAIRGPIIFNSPGPQ